MAGVGPAQFEAKSILGSLEGEKKRKLHKTTGIVIHVAQNYKFSQYSCKPQILSSCFTYHISVICPFPLT